MATMPEHHSPKADPSPAARRPERGASRHWRWLLAAPVPLAVWLTTRRWDLTLAIALLELGVHAVLARLTRAKAPAAEVGERAVQPVVIWLTGLSGAGKSTIAQALIPLLEREGHRVAWLDGDITRGILPKLGFTKADRDANVLKTGFIARTLETHGITVVASYISPYRETRAKVGAMCRHFVEVHLNTPLATCEARDVKGLYAKARAGEIQHFTGIDDPYEEPEAPAVRIDTSQVTVAEACAQILAKVSGGG